MPLPTPNLDDRTFQDLVDEAKRMIPRYCPEWTDHNVSDPGVTLIELFAWMTELLIYRLNRVPEKSYITFMELIGLRLQPPAAASVELTFWLAAPAAAPVTIPAGSQAGTSPTGAERGVDFRTDADLVIRPPQLTRCLTSADERAFTDVTRALGGEGFPAFSGAPQPGGAFYLGFAADVGGNILALTLACRTEGFGVDPSNPPLVWEAWQGDSWVDLDVERDETGGLNRSGQVVLYLPPRLARRELGGASCAWVRCRFTPPDPGQPGYVASPRILSAEAAAVGGMVTATHATPVSGEILGRSTGHPGQRFQIEHTPVLPRRPGETILVRQGDGPWEAWAEVESFGRSTRADRHFTLDSVSGEVAFGPAVRSPAGEERQHGAVPPRGAQVQIARYRTGGGAVGNVGAGTITRLRSAIPYVDRVVNRRPAEGGRDAESLEAAKIRAPELLRSRDRAVTAEDFAYLAREASARVARAHCLGPGAGGRGAPPGTVEVYLVPSAAAEGYLAPEQLRVPQDVLRDVQAYLDERRLLTTTVRIDQPEYLRVVVSASLKARPLANLKGVRREALDRLYRFLNPLTGGPDGLGWPFGRDLYIAEVYGVLQGVPGINYIEQVSLALEGGEPQGHIPVPPAGLIVSAHHVVTVE